MNFQKTFVYFQSKVFILRKKYDILKVQKEYLQEKAKAVHL